MPNTVPGTDLGVSLCDVTVEVERVPVLRGFDFSLAIGECVGVMGANGSGKSTLLRVLATLLPPVRGEGWVLGAPLGTSACTLVRPRIALIGHTAALYPGLSLRENLRFLARLTGRDERAADESLDLVGLAGAAERKAEVCSHGMRRRAELARVLLTEPRLLLLDEAHAGLDESSLGLIESVVNRVRADGGACVLVSHDQPRLNSVADRVVEIVAGRARHRGGIAA
ncbi:MAG: ATP-binding cassette domain-containing protein [Actinophytocola sp.]|nr:ATP-binding cassette domain-containing protein [Actinophytocola sp.]